MVAVAGLSHRYAGWCVVSASASLHPADPGYLAAGSSTAEPRIMPDPRQPIISKKTCISISSILETFSNPTYERKGSVFWKIYMTDIILFNEMRCGQLESFGPSCTVGFEEIVNKFKGRYFVSCVWDRAPACNQSCCRLEAVFSPQVRPMPCT